jgi:hypothetical protein
MNTTYKAIELSGPGKFSEELFEVAHSPGKTGIVLLKSPI